MRLRFLSFYLFLFILSGSVLEAQNHNVSANIKEWNILSTDNFDIYFPGAQQGGAKQAARFAERARFEIGVLFDYKPESRYTLIYATDAQTLLNSNIALDRTDRIPGIFDLPARYGIVIHPETTKGLFQAVKREVAALILKDFTYGDRFGTTFQSQILLYEAPWFQEGLAEYVASGWTYEDQMKISAIEIEDLLDLALEGNQPINRLVRKSVWHFITHEYGEQKISEIIYLVNISHSIESGIISVLGINLNTLTARWKEFLSVRGDSQKDERMDIREISSAIEIPIPDNQKLVSFSYSVAQRIVAVYLIQGQKHLISLYDIAGKKWIPTNIKAGSERQDAERFAAQAAMAWDPNGQTLVSTRYNGHAYELVYLDRETVTHTAVELPSEIRQVGSLSWSSDGSRVLFSGLNVETGSFDIYALNREGEEVTAYTQDPFDNLDPIWMPGDQGIYFASNRDTVGLDVEGRYLNSFKTNFDLYRLDIGSAQTLQQITHTPSINERNPSWDEEVLIYQTDAVGIENIEELHEAESGEFPTISHVSDIATGFLDYQQEGEHIILAIPEESETKLLLMTLESLRVETAPAPTLLRLQYEAEFEASIEEERRLAELESQAESLSSDEEIEPAPEIVEEEAIEEAEESPKNTQAKYYIFDEEGDDYEAPSSVATPIREQEDFASDRIISTVFGKKTPPKLEDIRVGMAVEAQSPWKISSVGFALQFDPIAKLGPEFTLEASDLLGNHKIELRTWPSFNLRNSETVIRYTYLKPKIDLFAEVGHRSRRIRQTGVVQSDSLIFRFDRSYVDVGARYPIRPYLDVSAQLGFYRTDRKDQQLLRANLQNALDHLLHGRIQLTLDRVKEVEGYQYKGIFAQAGVESFYSFAQNGIAFQRAKLELKHYREISGPIVLATRLASSITSPISLKQFYMGDTRRRLHRPIIFQSKDRNSRIQNEVTDTTLHAIHFLEFVTPVRGFLPNTRNGSRYVVANLELRIPLSRMTKHSLPANPLYNLEIIPFVDAGTVWEDGNPFSQKKPTDTHYIPSGPVTIKLQTLKSPFLIGFGSGIRTNVLGWSARMDVAWGLDDYSLQSPILTTSLAKNF